MTKTVDIPPREWFEENFVEDGKVRYCSACKAIPYMFSGHWCTGIEARSAGLMVEIVEAPYRWEDVKPVPSDDRPDSWMLAWVGSESVWPS